MNHLRIYRLIPLCFLFLNINADKFSNQAEKQNILDHMVTHPWSTNEIPIKIDISGYVKAEAIFDSRQNFTERDGQFLYFPLNRLPDVQGKDINARGEFDEYAIQTRIRFEGFGPDIGCMNGRSYIEADFFGTTDDTVDTFRLRHAYISLESEHFNFLGGQTWHPMYLPVEAPDTISFNTGTPIDPYARNPQFRLMYHDQKIDIFTAFVGWLGDRPFGPVGPSSVYFRNAIMPEVHVHGRLKWDDANSYIGAGFDVMRIVPRLATNLNYKEVNPFTSIAATVYSRLSYDDCIFLYSKFAYAQDAAIFDMIGGYGVHSVDPDTDRRTYTPLQTISFWSELIFEGTIEPALFIGFVKNLGARKTIIPNIGNEVTIYGIGTNINTVFRASPRIRWYIESFVVGLELEYTRATYGILNNYAKVENTMPVGNARFLFATYYIF